MIRLLLVLCCAFLLPVQVLAGGENGGGGDTHSQDFVKAGWALYTRLSILPKKSDVPIDLAKFESVLLSTKVEATDKQLLLDGVPKHAINYLDTKRILFNESHWATLSEQKKQEFVIHEYLRLMGVDDSKYQVSARILEQVNGATIVQMVDALRNMKSFSKALRSSLERIKRQQACYQISELNRVTDEMKALYDKSTINSQAAPTTLMAVSRLVRWSATLAEFCTTSDGKVASLGFYQKASDRNLAKFLTLMERDSTIALVANCASCAEAANQNASTIWDSYVEILEKISKGGE